jgi:hypothetical protein
MSRSSLFSISVAIQRVLAEHFLTRIAFSFRVEKMVLILVLRADPGANRKIRSGSIPAAFRRLFATAQSMASSKLANPLTSR